MSVDVTTEDQQDDYVRVGVRELKAKLSEYLARAAAGETILVTDRGRPKALITRPTVEQRIAQGIHEGWIRPGRGRPSTELLRLQGRISIDEALAEDRGE